MQARVHQDTAEFRDAAWPVISADPIKYTHILTATANPLPGALLVTLHDNGKVVGALMRGESYPMIVSAMPADAAEFTARTVHELLPDLQAVSGPIEQTEAFVAAWTALTGAAATLTLAMRVFKLGKLRPPEIGGAARRSTPDDLPLLIHWFELFLNETLPPPARHARVDNLAKATLEPGAASMFWEVDGEPVALAAARGPVVGMSRIAPVYTPPEHRGHGYASAVTAAVTQWALDEGSEHVLIVTDLANPTTNHIFPQIGYEPIEDSAEYRFS
jgi:predicted GNAT family acetyltransferase